MKFLIVSYHCLFIQMVVWDTVVGYFSFRAFVHFHLYVLHPVVYVSAMYIWPLMTILHFSE
jgi:hypothetical protein